MATAGESFTSPIGEKLTFLQTASDTGGQLLEVEVTYVPGRSAPPEHVHPFQTEAFEVLSGTVQARIGGQEADYTAGDRFEISPGVPHTMWNGGSEVARMRWQVQPALRTEAFFEALWSLAHHGKADAEGKPGLLQFAVIARTYDREFRLARFPVPIQKALFGLLAFIGTRMGYRVRYTDRPGGRPRSKAGAV